MSTTDLDPAALAALLHTLSMSQIDRDRATLANPVPIREWIKTYLTHLSRKSESECTLVSYESTLRLFGDHVEAHEGRVSKAIIESFLESRSEFSRGANPANTWNRHLSAIRSLFKYLVGIKFESGCEAIYQEQAMAVDRLTKGKSEAHPLEHVDATAILNSALGVDERAWFSFCYFAGLRRFEVGSLQIGQIDVTGPYEDRWLRNIRMKGKGERRFGDVPYGLMTALIARHYPTTVGASCRVFMECVEAIVASRGPDPETPFCVRMDDRDPGSADRFKWVNDDFHRLRDRCGVTTYYKPHDLRDSANTNLANIEGLSPSLRMAWIRHQDAETNALYTKLDHDQAKRLLE